MSTFSAADYIKSANEREQSARDGKQPEAKPAAAVVETKVVEAKATPEDGETHEADHAGRVSRSTRRLLRQLGEAEGRAKVLEELVRGNKVDTPTTPAEEDPEPKRDKFPDQAAYQAELTKWQARKETSKQIADKEQLEAYRTQLRAMDAKAMEDKKTLQDYDQVAQEAMDDGPEFVPSEHPNLMGLLATSDVKAYVLYHMAKHPEELEKMLELSKRPGEQIRAFARLEGRIEKLYVKEPEKKDEKKAEEKKPETAVERDAKKAKPSESVAVKSGSAPPAQVSPVLADGKTLNPAWKDRANEREGRRR